MRELAERPKGGGQGSGSPERLHECAKEGP